MGSRAARPGWCAGGQGRAPPPGHSPAPCPEGIPGKAHPEGFSAPYGRRVPAKGCKGPTPFALSLGLVLLWLCTSLPEGLTLPGKGAGCDRGGKG